MTESRRPLHLGVFIGLSAGAYALSLAAVTALQAQSEARVAADRAPTEQAIADLATRNDRLEAAAAGAGRTYERATNTYDLASRTLADLETRLAGLAQVVGAVEGASRSLPDHVALPRVIRTVSSVRPPSVHATTAASGG